MSAALLLWQGACVSIANTYYISNSGSGSNAYPGTSESQPWEDFANVNGRTFSPGDQILLKSGDTFCLTSSNVLTNPSFETGDATDWHGTFGSIQVTTTKPRSGNYSCYVTNRTYLWGSASRDVTEVLRQSDQGLFDFSGWIAMETGTDSGKIVLAVSDSAGTHFYQSSAVSLSTTYAKASAASVAVTWTGTLNSAYLYAQTVSTTGNMYLDDFSLRRTPVVNTIANAGFETGNVNGWGTQGGCSIAPSQLQPHTGTYSCHVTGRNSGTDSVTKDVTAAMTLNGYNYKFSAWVALGSGRDTGVIVLEIVDSSGIHLYKGNKIFFPSYYPAPLSNLYYPLTGSQYVSWTGTLTSAKLYIETVGNADLYVDDFSFMPLGPNAVANAGFELGSPSGWTPQNCTLGVTTTQQYQGSYAGLVTGRGGLPGGSPLRDITSTLTAYGPGIYLFSTKVALVTAAARATGEIVLEVVDGAGTHRYAGPVTSLSTAYATLSAVEDVNWVGSLISAKLYLETPATSTPTAPDLYVDDFSFAKGSSLLVNPGFEQPLNTGWSSQDCTIGLSTTNLYSGAYSCHVTARTATGSPVQDVTALLSEHGPGNYAFGAVAALDAPANTVDTGYIVLTIQDSLGVHSYSNSGWLNSVNTPLSPVTPPIVVTQFSRLSALRNVTWSGTLFSAKLSVETMEAYDLYVDDFNFGKTVSVAPLGSGTSTNPITLGSYGAGSDMVYPTIDTNSTGVNMIFLGDPSYWTVTNLNLTNGSTGVYVDYTLLGKQGVVLKNLRITNLLGAAIKTTGFNTAMPDVTPGASQPFLDQGNPWEAVWTNPYTIDSNSYIFSGLTIQNVSWDNSAGITLLANSPSPVKIGQLGANWHAQQNILIKNVIGTNTFSAQAIINAKDVLVMDSYLDNRLYGSNGPGHYDTGTSNVTRVNGVYVNTGPSAFQLDHAQFIWDNTMEGMVWRGNFFRNNQNAALEGAENPWEWYTTPARASNIDFDISCNGFSLNSTYYVSPDTVSTGDGTNGYNLVFGTNHNTASGAWFGDISVGASPSTLGTIQHNLYFDNPQVYNTFVNGADPNIWTVTDNHEVTSDGDMYSSAYQFSGTQGQSQWRYQYWNSAITDLTTYVSSTGGWSDRAGEWSNSAGAKIGRFNMTPPSSGYVVRTWKAPKAGVVNVTGWVLMNTTGGGGVLVGVAGPNGWIWPTTSGPGVLDGNDQVGLPTNVTVSVNPNQTISFWVSKRAGGTNDNNTVSWAPMIGYSTGTTDIALGKTVVASAASSASPASGSVDVNTVTYWGVPTNTQPQWLTVDLGAAYNLQKVKALFYTRLTWTYKIEGSTDNANWTILANHTSTGVNTASTADIVTGTYRYVRITVTNSYPLTGAGDYGVIRDLQIFN